MTAMSDLHVTPVPVHLRHGASEVELLPAIGGAVARFAWRGRDILRPAPDCRGLAPAAAVRRMGCYPLLPYSNRIGAARLHADGTVHALRPNFPPEPHSLHGFGWQRPWQVADRSDSAATLVLDHAADADWPYACGARQDVRLDRDGLHLALTLTNTDARAMPAGLGWHPYFPLAPGLRLHTEWTDTWPTGTDGLPQGDASVPAPSPFRAGAPVDGWRVDRCYGGWNRHARLHYAGYDVDLRAGEDCDYLVCFAPDDERRFVALEPVTHATDAFALAARGVHGTGMRLLAPGEVWRIEMTILVREVAHD
jgi:aldose 1-epimerase